MSRITLKTINKKIREHYDDNDACITVGEGTFCEHCGDLGFDIEVDKGGITYCYNCCRFDLPLTEDEDKFLERLLIDKEILYLEERIKHLKSL